MQLLKDIIYILKSRTVLTLIFTLLFSLMQAFYDVLAPETYSVLMTIILALAAYFRIDTKWSNKR